MTRAPYAALRSLSIWTCLGTVCAFAVAPSALFGATECYTGSCTATCTPNAPAAVSTLVSGFPGVNDTPIAFVDPADNLRHRFVATQEGVIFVWSGETQALLPVPFLDLTSTGLNKVLYGGERGLLAMAVEPDYRTTGRFYVYYTRVSDGDIVVERYQRSTGNPDVADPASGTVIFRIDHPAANRQRRPTGVRSGRLSVHLDGRWRTAVRQRRGSLGRRPEPGHAAGKDPAHRRARGGVRLLPPMSAASTPPTTLSPPTTLTSARRARATRSGRWACATPSASPSIGTPATSTWATLDRTSGRRSTSSALRPRHRRTWDGSAARAASPRSPRQAARTRAVRRIAAAPASSRAPADSGIRFSATRTPLGSRSWAATAIAASRCRSMRAAISTATPPAGRSGRPTTSMKRIRQPSPPLVG